MKIYYAITIIDDLSLGVTSATVNSANTLDYIPGSAIMGALASKIYSESTPDIITMADELFQKNEAFFSNCLPLFPLNDNPSKLARALPVPLCLHTAKNDAGKRINRSAENNTLDKTIQWKQIRTGYITDSFSDFSSNTVEKSAITRTAIDSSTYTAQEGKLFTQEFIHKGQSFLGYVECDDSFKSIIMQLFDDKVIRLGRSRGSEFGRAQIKMIEAKDISSNYLPVPDSKHLFIWCISNIEFYDTEYGIPTAVPRADNIIGMQIKAEFNASRSFIRTENVRNFNRKRGGFDGEKILVKAGSIICFDLQSPLSKEDLIKIQQKGIGLNRQQGYGEIIVNPDWINKVDLANAQFETPIAVPKKILEITYSKPGTESRLYSWLMEQYKKLNYDLADKVDCMYKQIIDLYLDCRAYSTEIPDTCQMGPSTTQWRILSNLLKTTKRDINKFQQKMYAVIDNISNDPIGWGVKHSYNDFTETFNCAFRRIVEDTLKDIPNESVSDFYSLLFEKIHKGPDLSVRSCLYRAKEQ